MSILQIHNLYKSYNKDIKAVNNLSLTVEKGIIIGLLGLNGAGKSTLINILAGILKRDKGDISIFGERINAKNQEYKRKTGFVFERPIFLEKLTIKEYLNFSAVLHQISSTERKLRVEESLDFFDLRSKQDDWIETCSKGMKKKVSLASALIHQPQLLILDEPFEGIDPISLKYIKENLSLMANRGVSIMITSHNLDTIEKFCNEVAIIDNGNIVFQDKRENFGNNSLEDIFINKVSKNNRINQSLKWLRE